MTAKLLVVEDRDSLRRLLERALTQEGFAVDTAASAAEAEVALSERDFDLLLTDLMLPDGSGLDVLRFSRQCQPMLPVVVMTAFGSVDKAVAAMKLGATDFVEKPVELDDLFELVRGLVDERSDAAVFRPPGDAPPIVGRHPRLRAALRLLERVAPTDTTVLLTGDSGTGKELFARGLHALSKRTSGPFVAVNCAAIPEALMENELFGHEKGAFTGAGRRQKGRFELAEGGTIFLDEIGELRLELQGKVLRVLEERSFESIGGTQRHADVRIVTATNRDLSAMVDGGSFRRDLFYRLDVFPIALPALTERRGDIPDLARHLIERVSARLGSPPPALSRDGAACLAEAEWPGNVRQLSNVLERALILLDQPQLTAADLKPLLTPEVDDEEARLKRALSRTGGDKQAAARQLGISYRTLQRKVVAYDLEGFPKYRS